MSSLGTRASRALRRSSLSLALGLSLTTGMAHAAASGEGSFALVPAGTYPGNIEGRQLVKDYGAVQLWRFDAGARQRLGDAERVRVQWQSPTIHFEAGDLDLLGLPLAPAGFAVGKSDLPTIRLLQFHGPIDDGLMQRMEATGARRLASLSGNSFAFLVDAQTSQPLDKVVDGTPLLRAHAALPAFYKLSGNLAARQQAGFSADETRDGIRVTVQVAKHARQSETQAIVQALARDGAAIHWDDRLALESARLKIDPSDLATLASLPDVFAIEPYTEPTKLDEIQSQILAGNLNAARSAPSGTGYLGWLNDRGFPNTPESYPIVDIVDDGLGTGDASAAAGDVTLRQFGEAANASRVVTVQNCTNDASGNGLAGHGHINTSIVGGYDARGNAAGIQTPFEDPDGYLRGLGVNPYTRLAHTKIFKNSGNYNISACGGTDAGLIRSSHSRGAAITSNSWGAGSSGDYDDSSQAYDIGTRDADLTTTGSQPLIHIFAAGNDGSGSSTVGSPGTGKNIITVGASENYRPGPDESGTWTDGCGEGASSANNAMDVIAFSSRGPAEGSRIKPEVIAPGTHVQGTASTVSGYDGSGTCDKYRPTNQTVFAASSGTSHSTPAIAGVASLMYYWLQHEHDIAQPSAAVMKAYMMAHPTYLTGVGANDTLPSNSQGYGMPNLGAAFDTSTQTVVLDQEVTFGSTGESHVLTGSVDSNSKPLRIALAWSDAPGAISDSTPQVNDLNLIVTVNGVTYTGNRFTGQYSTAGGGAADSANNYEAVFLPAGTTGAVEIRVVAQSIAGDGVPNNADTTDQDFALVASNFSQAADFGLDIVQPALESCGVGTLTAALNVSANNGYVGTVNLSAPSWPSGIAPSLTPASGAAPFASSLGISVGAGLADGEYVLNVEGSDGSAIHTDSLFLLHSTQMPGTTLPTSPANGASNVGVQPLLTWDAATGATGYRIEIDDNADFSSPLVDEVVTGTSFQPATNLSGGTTYYWRITPNNHCGPSSASAVAHFTTLPVFCFDTSTAIPDNSTAGVSTSINVSSALAGTLTDLNVSFKATHSYIGDLIVTLSHDGDTARSLMDRPGRTTSGYGCSGADPDIVFDDEGTSGSVESSCTSSGYTSGGHYTPNDTLSAFDGQGLSGTWTLKVSDNASGDTGSIAQWCLIPTLLQANQPPVASGLPDQSLVVGTAVSLSLAGAFSDPEGQALTYSLDATPALPSSLVFDAAAGTLSGTPLPVDIGSYVVTVTASDPDSATASISFTLTITANLAPEVFEDGFEDQE